MSAPAILDTSIFVAIDQSRPLARPLPDQVGVSVVTLAELELGVLMAKDGESRATRLATLTRVREQTAGLHAWLQPSCRRDVTLVSTTHGSPRRP